MNEKILREELECYKLYINPNCDINNLSNEDREDFFRHYKESEKYYKLVTKRGVAKALTNLP